MWFKSPSCQFLLPFFHREGEKKKKQNNNKSGGRKISSERCIFVRVGRVLERGSSGPLYGQGRERVWSWGQRDLLSLSERFTARREVLIRTEDFLIGERKDNWETSKTASKAHRLGKFASSWLANICLKCNKHEETLLCTDLISRKHICLDESSVCCNLHVWADCNFSFMATCWRRFTPGQPVTQVLSVCGDGQGHAWFLHAQPSQRA